MSAPPRGPRGGRGPRARGGSRGGLSSRPRNADGNDSDSSRAPLSRGRGRGASSQSGNRGIAQAFQHATRQQSAPRGDARTPRGGGTTTTPTLSASFASPLSTSTGETPEQRFHRVRDVREAGRSSSGRGNGYVSGSSLSLANAKGMVGICQDMCPEYERARRIFQRDVWAQEKMVVPTSDGKTELVVDESKMVKRFQRSAAGTDEQTATDLRPPPILLGTIEYLFNDMLSDEDALLKNNQFIWDRTRAIRNDFSIQQVKKTDDIRIAIECFEKIARFHILSLHQAGTKSKKEQPDSYDWQQDREQLDKTLLSLLTYYDKVQKRYRSPNEAEFRSYWIIFQIGNITANVEDKAQSWPSDLLRNKRIQRALDVYAAGSDIMSHKGPLQPWAYLAVAQQNWQKFWNLIGSKQTSYLLACVAEIGFNLIRRVILTSLCVTYRQGKKDVPDWTLDKVAEVLGFDDEDTTRDYLEKSNLGVGQTQDGTEYLQLSVRTIYELPDPQADLPRQTQSWHLVERKRFGRSWSALIAGMSFRTAKENGMLLANWNDEVRIQSSEDEGMFVPEEKQNNTPASTVAPPNPFAAALQPTVTAAETKPVTSNPFGQPSAFGQPAATTSAFGQPATSTSPFGQPPAAAPMFQSPILAAPAATNGSFGASPKPFSFSNGTSAEPTPAEKLSEASPANPFATLGSGKPLVPSIANTSKPAPSPFSFAVPQKKAEISPANANPFAGLGTVLTPKKPEPTSNVLTAPAATKTPAVPAFQITPPQEANKTGSVPSASVPQAKAPFQFLGGAGFGPNPTGAQFTPAETQRAAAPTSFDAPPRVTSTPKPVEVTEKPDFSIFPQKVSNSLPAHQAQVSQSVAPFQTPLPEFAPAASGSLPKAASPFAPASKAPARKHVSFAHQPAATPFESFTSGNEATEEAWEHTRETQSLDYLAERLTCDTDNGILNQFFTHLIGPIIQKAQAKNEQRKLDEKANAMRKEYLVRKYGQHWKSLVRTLKSRRKRKEMKQRNAEIRERKMAMSQGEAGSEDGMRLSISEQHDLYKAREEQRRTEQAETAARERQRLREKIGGLVQPQTARTSITNSFDLIGQRHIEPPATNGNLSRSSRGHQRSKTQPNILAPRTGLNRVLKAAREASPTLSFASSQSSMRASLINGSSIDTSGLQFGKRASTMQNPYFRLKAAGFGSSLKNSFTSSVAGTKRSRLSGDQFSGSSSVGEEEKAPALKRIRSPADVMSFSSPLRPQPANLGTSFGSSTSSNGAIKRSAEDEDLLARARRLRETLEQDENWFKDEVQKEELRRSQLGSRPSSQAGLPIGPNGEDLSKLPKFYSRVSRFVPREEYGKRPGKKEEPTEKEKEKLNGNRLSNGTNGRGASKKQMPPPPPPPRPAPSKTGSSWDNAIEL